MNNSGTVNISERAVAQLAAHTAAESGILRLADKRGRKGKGVYITKSKRGNIIEINIICRYGTNTVKICEKITKRIKSELEGIYNLASVNVKVVGVEK